MDEESLPMKGLGDKNPVKWSEMRHLIRKFKDDVLRVERKIMENKAVHVSIGSKAIIRYPKGLTSFELDILKNSLGEFQKSKSGFLMLPDFVEVIIIPQETELLPEEESDGGQKENP